VGAEETNRSEILSRILADLFVKSKEGEGLSSKIHHLRDEIKQVIESEDTIFGKFRGLVESFREIIPEEKQRYNAAIQALSTTSKLNQQEIVKAVNNQLEELKILEKGLMPALPGWRDEFKAMESKSQEMRDEISKLREKIGQLESEEKGILSGMAARKKEMELVEKAVGELFADLGGEITSIKKKVEEFTAESAASQPIPAKDSIKSDDIFPSKGKGGGERKSEIPGSSTPQDTEWRRKCPMCGGRLDFYAQEEMWQCYSCAYEEEKNDEILVDREESEPANESQPAPASKPSSGPSPLRAAHMGSLPSNEDQEPKKGSSLSINQPSSKKKTCPVCRKKMDWFEMEKAWRCPFCDYERSI
jgi:DNA-directed RNA polymerase subunit M/transcription elongation factor TFIIS